MLITLEPGEFGLDGGGDGSESETSCTGRTGVRLTYSVSHVPVHSRTGGLGVSGSEHRSDQSENGHNPMTQSKLFRKGLSLILESNRSTAFVGDQGIGIQPAEPPMLRHRRLKWFQKAYPPAEAKGTTFRRSCFTSGDVHLRDATQQEYASESFALRARKGAPSRHAA